MSDEAMGDEVYQQTGGNEEQEDAAPLDLQNVLDERDYDAMLDEGYSPPERPLGVEKAGTTAGEQREGEPLDDRLREETPDTGTADETDADGVGDLPGGAGEPLDSEVGDRRAGRLVAPDEGTREDVEQAPLASDVGIDGGAAGAEEAAMHVVPEPDLDAGPEGAEGAE
ncbi:DUF5709 domain-containing protein [Streptomyces sp. CC208A]|uniref:DUF5709 domain-containing protein n=1 Tax=Streptomyces sp. CC208A TaxID=3044573 RepID=UPI0024A97956|nr:DUF5709 domain-containing protein [Streptomyces sp. CC208A]